uniref:Taste receptor type 2 n=1 Tax=Leptobrachium leishanense TaxID=445787 RepID=A0A8C5QCC7_9ANUR
MLPLTFISAFVLVDGLIGFILNTVILAINLRDWTKGARLQPFHYIHIVMALVNILLQCAVVLGFFMGRTPLLDDQYKFNAVFISMSFLFFLCFWLNACLCAYYLTSIASFNHHFFAWLKTHFSAIIPKFILVAAVGSFIVSFSGIWKVSLEKTTGTYDNLTMNSVAMDLFYFVVLLMGAVLPLIFTLLPIGLTLASIWRHMKRIQKNEHAKRMKKNDFFTPQMEAHITATRTIVLLVVLYAFFYMSCASIVLKSFNMEEILVFWIYVFNYPMAQSIVITLGNSKLKKAAKRIQNHLEKWWKDEL